jgi:AmiR/NasT family two-component response regulator
MKTQCESCCGSISQTTGTTYFLTVDKAVAEQAKRIGVAAYLKKPITVPAVLAVVRRFIIK